MNVYTKGYIDINQVIKQVDIPTNLYFIGEIINEKKFTFVFNKICRLLQTDNRKDLILIFINSGYLYLFYIKIYNFTSCPRCILFNLAVTIDQRKYLMSANNRSDHDKEIINKVLTQLKKGVEYPNQNCNLIIYDLESLEEIIRKDFIFKNGNCNHVHYKITQIKNDLISSEYHFKNIIKNLYHEILGPIKKIEIGEALSSKTQYFQSSTLIINEVKLYYDIPLFELFEELFPKIENWKIHYSYTQIQNKGATKNIEMYLNILTMLDWMDNSHRYCVEKNPEVNEFSIDQFSLPKIMIETYKDMLHTNFTSCTNLKDGLKYIVPYELIYPQLYSNDSNYTKRTIHPIAKFLNSPTLFYSKYNLINQPRDKLWNKELFISSLAKLLMFNVISQFWYFGEGNYSSISRNLLSNNTVKMIDTLERSGYRIVNLYHKNEYKIHIISTYAVKEGDSDFVTNFIGVPGIGLNIDRLVIANLEKIIVYIVANQYYFDYEVDRKVLFGRFIENLDLKKNKFHFQNYYELFDLNDIDEINNLLFEVPQKIDPIEFQSIDINEFREVIKRFDHEILLFDISTVNSVNCSLFSYLIKIPEFIEIQFTQVERFNTPKMGFIDNLEKTQHPFKENLFSVQISN